MASWSVLGDATVKGEKGLEDDAGAVAAAVMAVRLRREARRERKGVGEMDGLPGGGGPGAALVPLVAAGAAARPKREGSIDWKEGDPDRPPPWRAVAP